MNISYTLVGMTRGHASRALAVGAELIKRGHSVRFYTNLDAYELLTKRFGFDSVYDIEMPKYIFKEGKICMFSTLVRNSELVLDREKYTKPITDTFDENWMPDLTISDFEPLAWWISKKYNIPHVTLDSQRFMITSEMPQRLPFVDNIQRLIAWALLYIFSPKADLRIVSKQFAIPTDTAPEWYVGAITRGKVDELEWSPAGTHFLVYIKDSLIPRLLEIQKIAEESGLIGRIYGVSSESLEKFSKLQYGQTCEQGFLETLSTSEFVITTPGSQTLAETWSLGIPAYLLPERNQFEQQINMYLAIQAEPEQYAKFKNEHILRKTPLKGRQKKANTSAGRMLAVDLIESLAR